jgi:hypothetical protein
VYVLDSVLSVAEAPSVEVTRWRLFRQDRAYVRRNGRHIGFRDLRTGTVYAFDPADADTIAGATADVLAASQNPHRDGGRGRR